jgi:NDP-sugar pyrophosphorylase family protein
LALGHKAEVIQTFFQRKKLPFPAAFSIESSPLGTGGALLHSLTQATQETLLVLNGDSYFDLPISDFFRFHHDKKADFSIACCLVPDTSRYGRVEIDPATHRISSFREKTAATGAGWINAGIYLMQRSVLAPFPSGASSLEKDFFPRLVQNRLFGYCHRGSFIDIGTPDSYQKAQEILQPWIPA